MGSSAYTGTAVSIPSKSDIPIPERPELSPIIFIILSLSIHTSIRPTQRNTGTRFHINCPRPVQAQAPISPDLSGIKINTARYAAAAAFQGPIVSAFITLCFIITPPAERMWQMPTEKITDFSILLL